MTRKLLFILTSFFWFMPAFSHVSEVWVDADQTQLFCRTIGQGKPLIVVHGGPDLTQDYLLPQLYELGEDHFVIFYDQRGCGKSVSEINLETINIPTFVNDLDTIRKAFNFETISILGHSWGGFLAMEYAIAHPEAVEKFILSNSLPSSSDEMQLVHKEWLRRTAPYQEELATIRNSPGFKEGDPENKERYYRLLFRAYCHDPEKVNLLSLSMSSEALINGAKVFSMFRQNLFEKPFNLHDQLKMLTTPTLIIHGDDEVIPPSIAQNTHECLVNSQFFLIKQCGHFPYIEQPEMFFAQIKTFLAE